MASVKVAVVDCFREERATVQAEVVSYLRGVRRGGWGGGVEYEAKRAAAVR
jgi:hypothetical protein